MLIFLTALYTPAQAQPVLEADHPLVPASSVAAEGGPGTLWVNPASIGLDRDARFGGYLSAPLDGSSQSLALTAGAEGFGLGLQRTESASDERAWIVDYASSLALPGGWALGGMLRWNLPENATNHVGYDAGVSWRPLPWLGFGAVAQNLGGPEAEGLAASRSTVGVALRPMGRRVLVGLDARRIHGSEPSDQLLANARVRAVEGLYLRTGIALDATSPGPWSLAHAGAGLEVFFGGMGGGYHYGGASSLDLHTLWLGSDEPHESLVKTGHSYGQLDLTETPPYQRTQMLFLRDTRSNWSEVMRMLEEVTESSHIEGVLITMGNAPMSWALHEEIQARIQNVRASGRKVVVYLQGSPSTATYATAAGADVVWMHPASNLDVTGIRAAFTHFRGALDLLGVEPEYVRRSEYKSGPEQFDRHEPSEPALAQINALLDDRMTAAKEALRGGRGVDESTVEGWINGGPHSATEALELGLVDDLLYPDQLDLSLEKWQGSPVQMSPLTDLTSPVTGWDPTSQIAVIYIDGVIVDGSSSGGGLLGSRQSGSETVAWQLKQAAEDPSVKAVVLRVDSPGGSAYASDEIARAVSMVQKEGKPVVASFGGVAASGGYYVAAGADTIWAEPNTVTGSIGVYTVKFAAEKMLEKIGIETTSVSRGPHADLYSAVDPWDASERARVEALVEDTYVRFKAIVAEGRGMSDEEVEEVARGRVWSGTDAKDVGLIDQFGGLHLAIEDARSRANIPDHHEIGLATYQGETSMLESLTPSLLRSSIATLIDTRQEAALPDGLRAALETFGPALVMAAHPEERSWALDARFWLGSSR